MGITQAVTTKFKAKDEQSKIFNKMGRSSKKFGETSERAFKKASKAARGFGSVTKGILGAQVIGKGVGLLSEGLRSVTTDFLGFDNAVLSAAAKFKGLDLTTQKGIKTLQALKKTARETGAATEFNAFQAGQGLDFLALAGFNATQAMALLPGVTNLATVAQVDLATATDIASDSLGAFGLMTDNTEQLTKNFTRVQDVMAKTTATSNTNLTDLFEAVKKGAPDFTAAGQSIETFSTLIGTMANAGIKGSEAGTKLRNMATRLAKPTKEAAILMDKLGIRVDDGKGKFRDMLSILDDVRKGTAKMGKVQRTAALATIFGVRQTGGLNVILAESDDKLRKYRKSLEDSTGAAAKMAKIMRSSLINRLASLGSALTEVGFQLFSAFDTQGAGAIETLTNMVRTVDMTPIIDGMKTVAKFAGQVFDKFVDIGKRTGLFDSAQQAAKNLEPFFSTIKEIAGDVWGFFEDTGTIDLAAKAMGTLLKAVGPIAKGVKLLWDSMKPILGAMQTILTPVIKGLGIVLDAVGDQLDRLDARFAKSLRDRSIKKSSSTLLAEASQNIKAPARFGANQLLGGATDTRADFNRAQRADISSFASQGLLAAIASRIAPEFARGRGEQERIKIQQQNVNVGGKFTFENAPKGTEFTPSPGSEKIDVTDAGASPAEL